MNHSILVPGPSRCSNQPLPCRERPCATNPCAWVMFGKCPTRIFVSPKEKTAAANHNEIDNQNLEIFIPWLSILSVGRRKSIAQTKAVDLIAAAGPPGFRCPSDNETNILKIGRASCRERV